MICTSVITSLRSGHQGTLQPAAEPKLLAHGLLAAFHGWSRWRPAPRPAWWAGRALVDISGWASLVLGPASHRHPAARGERQNPEEARA
jgi:hypothetical protein